MPRRKSFIAPIWFLAFIICVQVYFLYIMITIQIDWNAIERKAVQDGHNYASLSFVRKIVEGGITILVLTVECVAFWRVRRKRYWKAFAWVYISLLFCALVALPVWGLAVIRFVYLLSPHVPLYWYLVALAHVCFILLLVQAYFRQKEFMPTDADNILDDYSEE